MDPSAQLSQRNLDSIKKHISKLDRTHSLIENICVELEEAIELPAEEMVSLLDVCLSPDVLVVEPPKEKTQIFRAIGKEIEACRVQGSYATGIPLPNKVIEALFSDIPDVLNDAKQMI